MQSPIYILWVDDYHLGDPLFAQNLARHLSQVAPLERRAIVVHGSGERAERLLEGRGMEVMRSGGILQVDGAGRQLVERALRETNKDLASVLTEFGVPAVGIQGSDRGLMKDGDDDVATAGNPDWLFSLVESGSVPVVSSLAGGVDGVREIAIGDVVAAIAGVLGADNCVIVVFPKAGGPGVTVKGAHQAEIAPDQLPAHVFEDQKNILDLLLEKGFPTRLTSARHAISADSSRFTRVLRAKSP